jgi:chromate transport protein ChrA
VSSLPLLRKFLWVGLTAFGAARWTNLYAAFVRPGLIPERQFLRDLAITQTLPGPGFVNLSVLCGLRLGNVPFALAAVTLVLLPGLVTMVLALGFVSIDAGWVQGFLHGILIGAVGVLASSLARLASRVTTPFDLGIALGALFLVALGVPLALTVIVVGAIGTWRYRATPHDGA